MRLAWILLDSALASFIVVYPVALWILKRNK